ncbi:MAG: hypothetical protein JST86_14675 [Bacteroidetes bacterium]|nr:hypothetical protein [Bacteroidota bacterium]
MKPFIAVLAVLCSPLFGKSQEISGLWTGTLYNDSTQQSLPYEVYITKANGKYSGISHTWFLVNDKQYYGIKKVKIRIAKDGKIIIQDEKLVENNYPTSPDKNVQQLDVLDLAQQGDQTLLNGPFATNASTKFKEVTGKINLKKTSPTSESSLMQYLQKSGNYTDVSTIQ